MIVTLVDVLGALSLAEWRMNMSDMKLKKAVEEELEWEPSIDTERVGAAAENSVITLSGHVSNYTQKFAEVSS
jgi:osmotically-inducible protein OsmY